MSSEPTTRERILDAACRLIEARGAADVRLEDIAKVAKVSRQAVYLHFSGRGELLASAVEHLQEKLGAAGKARAIEAAPNGREMLRRLVAFSAEYTPLIHPFALAIDSVRRTDEAAGAAWKGRQKSRLERARRIAKRLAEDGELAEGLGVDEAADLLRVMTSIATWEELVLERGWSAAAYVRRVQEVLERSLLAPSPTRKAAARR